MIKTWTEGFLNVFFWIITGWLIILGFSIEVQEVTIDDGIETIKVIRNSEIQLKLFIAVFISSISFYLNLNNISYLYRREKRMQVLVVAIILMIVPVTIFYLLGKYHLLLYLVRLPLPIIIGVFFFYFTISVAYGLSKVWMQTERQKQQLALEKKQTELTLLRAQLHPHFLFNVLNNLLSMVDQKANPVLASSLDQLSGLLRYVVYDTQNTVTVRKEIEFIRNFAELQIQRFEKDEIDFKLEIIGQNDLQKIEPGIFIPFIENIFKYGVEPEKNSKVIISFDLTEPNMIVFESSNLIYPALQKNKGNGSGISSTKARLELVYPHNHKLIITENDNFKVHLEFRTNASDYS